MDNFFHWRYTGTSPYKQTVPRVSHNPGTGRGVRNMHDSGSTLQGQAETERLRPEKTAWEVKVSIPDAEGYYHVYIHTQEIIVAMRDNLIQFSNGFVLETDGYIDNVKLVFNTPKMERVQ